MDIVDLVKELVVQIQTRDRQINRLNDKIEEVNSYVKLYEGRIGERPSGNKDTTRDFEA